MRHYRLLAHIFLVAMISFMTQWILNYRVYQIGFWHLSIGVVLIYGIVTWFIDIHTSAAEGLEVSYLTELELEEGYKYMRKIRPVNHLIILEYQRRITLFGCTAENGWQLLNSSNVFLLILILSAIFPVS
jgi:hypothetical protein